MDVYLQIGIGFLLNLIIFGITKFFKKTKDKSMGICFIAYMAVFLLSYFIVSWKGIKLLFVSLGLLLFIVVTIIFKAILARFIKRV